MDGSAHFFVGQCRDDTLDLSPVAEADDVSAVAALFGARGGLEPGIIAEALHKFGRLGEGGPPGDEGRVHARLLTRQPFRDGPMKLVKRSFTMFRLERDADLWHGRRMVRRTPMAGGFFLMAAIVGGGVWGIAIGNPMLGLLIGTGVGIAIAVLVWLVDRGRG